MSDERDEEIVENAGRADQGKQSKEDKAEQKRREKEQQTRDKFMEGAYSHLENVAEMEEVLRYRLDDCEGLREDLLSQMQECADNRAGYVEDHQVKALAKQQKDLNKSLTALKKIRL